MKKASYSRIITESLPQAFKNAVEWKNAKTHILGYSIVFLTVSFVVLAVYAAFLYSDYLNAKEQWLKTSDNLAYWEEVAVKQENSPDAYFEAALYAAKLGNNQKALLYIDKALELDPGFEKARELSQQLTKTTN